jgi:hypothetical protein
MSDHFERALYELGSLAKQADVMNPMRVSISFGSPRDRALFKAEIMREAAPQKYPETCITDEFQFNGLTVRIV